MKKKIMSFLLVGVLSAAPVLANEEDNNIKNTSSSGKYELLKEYEKNEMLNTNKYISKKKYDLLGSILVDEDKDDTNTASRRNKDSSCQNKVSIETDEIDYINETIKDIIDFDTMNIKSNGASEFISRDDTIRIAKYE